MHLDAVRVSFSQLVSVIALVWVETCHTVAG